MDFKDLEKLKHFRNEIDRIDKDIVNLICKRLEICRAIGEYKKENDLPILDDKRWDDVLSKVLDYSKERSHEYVTSNSYLIYKIYELIHETSKKQQTMIYGKRNEKNK